MPPKALDVLVADHEGITRFLKNAEVEIELRAVKLAQFYGVDHNDILSHAGEVTWQKWSGLLEGLCERDRVNYIATVMVNRAKTLARRRKRNWTLDPTHEHGDEEAPRWVDPAIEVLFRDEQLRIYRAIARMKPGRPKDVMVCIAMRFRAEESRAMLNMSHTNYNTQLSRGRGQLREILEIDGTGTGSGEVAS